MADADRVRDRWQSLRSALGETWVFAALEGEQWRGAVETGVVERLYDISAGVTEAIVAQGLDAEGALRLDESTFDQIAAHRHAADLVGDAVRADRPMSTGLLKEFHAAVTSAQPRYKAVDQFGRAVQGALLHGEYKTEDNHVRLPGGSVHHYAPAIQTASEVDRLVDFLAAAADEHPVSLAVFAHHRLTRIHPFQDGNGRAARLLATYYLIRGRFLPLTVTRDQRDAYFTALQHADAGDPLPLATFVVARQRDTLLRVEQRAFSADVAASKGVAGIARALAEYAAARRDGGGGREPADRFADLGRTTEVLLRQRLERALEPFAAHGFDTGAHSYGFDLTEGADARALLAGSGLRPREQAVLGRIRFGVEVGDAAWRYGSVVLAPLASVTGDEPIGLVFEGAGTLTVFADARDEAELTAWLDAGIARWLVGYVRLL